MQRSTEMSVEPKLYNLYFLYILKNYQLDSYKKKKKKTSFNEICCCMLQIILWHSSSNAFYRCPSVHWVKRWDHPLPIEHILFPDFTFSEKHSLAFLFCAFN